MQAQLGLALTLTAAEAARLEGRVAAEAGYLRRFATQLAVRDHARRQRTLEYTASRLDRYGAAGILSYWEGVEMDFVGVPGWVVYYVDQDDPFVCPNCARKGEEGPYVPGTPHPYPASNCLGRDRCRCWLDYRFEPRAYRSLLHRPPAA